MAETDDRELAELLELGDRVVKMATSRGATVAECILRSGADLSTRVRGGAPERVEEAGHRSAGLRVMKGKQVATTSTSDLSEPGIARFIADAIELADLAQEDPFAGPVDPELLCNPKTLPDLQLYDPACGAVNAAAAIATAKRAEAAARAYDPRVAGSESAAFARTAGGSAVVLSSGFRATNRSSYASLNVVAFAPDEGGKSRQGYQWAAKRFLAELDDAEDVGREAARRALRRLGARAVPTCEVPVVFDPEAARGILSMLAACVMGSAIWRRASYLVGREGTRVASDLVSVIDDPLIPKGPGSRAHDGEGLASRRNVVIEKGMLRTYLCDSYSARKLSRESTASASRGRGAGVGASTSNFILQPGSETNEGIVSGTPRGLYVTEMTGFGFNPITGDFSRGAVGFWIEGGALAFPVSEVTISLNVDELWQRIDAVGSDLDTRTSTTSPTLRVAKMSVAGSSK